MFAQGIYDITGILLENASISCSMSFCPDVFIFVKELLIDILTVSLPVSGWGHSGDPLRSQGSRVRRLLIIQNWIQEGVEAAAAAAGGQPVVNGLVSKITFEYLERLCYFESH